MPKKLLHFESFIFFISVLFLYGYFQFNWWIFVLCLLVPDISALGYLANQKVGSFCYNLVHTYIIPFVITALSLWTKHDIGLMIGLIWLAHISMDRTVGYGLKYTHSFKETHLQKI